MIFFSIFLDFRLFKECPHPDEKQRLELSKRLCLETRQVKFWFQNRRTQMKVNNTFAKSLFTWSLFVFFFFFFGAGGGFVGGLYDMDHKTFLLVVL